MYVVVDIETTGLSPHFHKITELAAVRIENGEVKESFQTLINPQVPISSEISRITGITNEMVRNAPRLNEVLPLFLEFLGDDVFVAHNAPFDYKFLQNHCSKHGKQFSPECLCTRNLANHILPNLYSKKLSALCQVFKIENLQAHRALEDAKATAQIFLKFLDILKQQGLTEQEVITNHKVYMS